MTTNFIPIQKFEDKTESLLACQGLPEVRHAHVQEDLYAINAALATRRPLLIRGEPGTGKSQLARAAAQILGRHFVWKVVDARTEISDLFYHFDAVERLGHAQLLGSLGSKVDSAKLFEALHPERFLRPGPLWKGFCWSDAEEQEKTFSERCVAFQQLCTSEKPKEDRTTADGAGSENAEPEPKATTAGSGEASNLEGCVVLIDEIDKADPSVPNGLLEALGQGTFPVPGSDKVISWGQDSRPLIILTTNESRELPDAFVRRCLVRHILLPEKKPELKEWLFKRGRVHFSKDKLEDEVLNRAVDYVVVDRQRADDLGLAKPGQAEFIDLLRAVYELAQEGEEPLDLLDSLRSFTLHKHLDVYKQYVAQHGASEASK